MTKTQRLARLIRQYESSRITKAELRRLLEKRVIGHVTGIVGPFVLRYHYGKLIISERALLYRESMSEEAVEGRSNFGAGVKFAKFLNEIPIIKEVWQNAPIAGRCSWNKLIRYNIINGMVPSRKNIITPDGHQIAHGNTCSMGKNFTITADKEEQFDENYELYIVIVPFDPINKNDASFEMLCIENKFLSEDQIALCKKYRRYIMYSAVIRNDGSKWSNTVSFEGRFVTEEKCDEVMTLEWLFIVERELKAEVGGRRTVVGDRRTEVGDRRTEVGDRKSEVRKTKKRQKLRCLL